jgi:hypothetical protein
MTSLQFVAEIAYQIALVKMKLSIEIKRSMPTQ